MADATHSRSSNLTLEKDRLLGILLTARSIIKSSAYRLKLATPVAWKIAVLYLIVGMFYVVLIDTLQFYFLQSIDVRAFIVSQSFAGMFFILFSAVGLYFLLRYYIGSVVRYKEVLSESEGRLRLALNNIPSVFVIYDNQLRFSYVNALGVSLSGYSLDEMLGHTDEELFAEKSTFEYLPLLKRTLEQRAPQSGECKVLLPDGREVVSVVQYVPLLDKNGDVIQIMGITHNVTDRVQAENALRHSEEQFRLLAENLPGLVYICNNDTDYSVIYVSQRVEAILGYKPEQMFNGEKTFGSLIHPDDLPDVNLVVQSALAEKRAYQLVYRIMHSSGEWRWVEEQGEGIYKNNELQFLQGFIVDVTKVRKERWKQELLSSLSTQLAAVNTLEKLGQVVLNTVSSIWAWDAFMFSVHHSGEAMIRVLVQADTFNGEKTFENPRVALMPEDLRRHEPLLILRKANDEVSRRGRFGDTSKPSQSLMYCPIQSGDRKGGLITVQSYTPDFFDADDLELLKTLSHAITPAAERCRVEERSSALSKLGEQLNATTTPEEAADIIVAVADGLIGWDACSIELFVAKENLLYDLVEYDIIDGNRAKMPIRTTPMKPGGYHLQTINFGQMLVLRDKDSKDTADSDRFGDTSRPSASMMYAVMRGQTEITGVLSLHSYTFQAYDEEDLLILQTLANHCSNALERTRAQQALQTRESNYRNAITFAGAVPYQLDYVTKSYAFMGEGIEAITGWTAEEFSVPLWNSMVKEVVQAGTTEKLDRKPSDAEPSRKNARWKADIRIVTKAGESRWVTDTSVDISDEDGQFRGSLGILQDISERKENENRLLYDSLHDPLTGLANRALLLDHLQLAIHRSQRRSTYCFAVLFIDIDRFKTINDSLGHLAGDDLLKVIAQRLVNSVRPDDTVARFAGDEFVLLLDDVCSSSDVIPVAERILQEIQLPVTLEGHEVFTSISMGIALSSPTYQHPEELLRDADNALYQAKSAGKARFEIFNTSMYQRAVEALALENDMRRALERNEFILHYQPIIDLKTGLIVKFEALVRWNHPVRGLVPPVEFIPMAEETGIIIPLGFWILEKAVSQLRIWQDDFPSNPPLIMSVNMSVRQFSIADLDTRINNIVQAHGVNPHCVKLEITETVFLEQQATIVDLLNRLKDLGFGLSLDDFGTGYSSLSNLHQFPIEWVKIDRSFTSRLDHPGREREIVRSIVQLASNLGIGVTAEGVETANQLAILTDMDCCHVQGYYLSRPLPADQATALLAASPNYHHA